MPGFPRVVRCLPLAMGLLLLGTAAISAGDWPQILGPLRNGTAEETLPEDLSAQQVRLRWQYPVGTGYAGPAVVGQRVILFHRQGDEEVVEALSADTGKRLWRSAFAATYQPSIDPDDGPLCVPLVADGRVYVFGAAADLHCLNLADGRTLWSHPLGKRYRVPPGYFGSGSAPLLVDGRLLLNLGGREGTGLVAFDPAEGKLLWKASDELASYAAPTAAMLGGKSVAVFVTRLNCLGIDPASGREYFRFPFGKTGPTVNAATPLVLDGHVFLTASYNIGAVWAKVSLAGAETVWANDDTLSSQYPTPVYHRGYLYGIDGRQDLGRARLRCIDPRRGKIQWTQDDFGMAAPILAGDRLLLVKTDGHLVVAAADPRGFAPQLEAPLVQGTLRALPALAGGRLYVRDRQHLHAFDLGKKK